jgi:hypothetical protein
MHMVDERVAVADLETLTLIYGRPSSPTLVCGMPGA